MSQETLPCVEVEPQGEVHHSVMWLHGLGADGHDFEPIVPELGIDHALGIRFLFPNAPPIPVTINDGMVMPAWYDILEMDLERRHDEAGVLRSNGYVEALIARENERGIPTSRIALCGFSQGGAIAVHAGLRHRESLAGILGLSTYMVRSESLDDERSEANAKTPILLAHGSMDPMVPMPRGAQHCERLKELGYDVEWHTYPMMHQVCAEEIQVIGSFLTRIFGSDD